MLCHTILYYSLLYYALVCYAISHLSDKNKTLAIISTYKYVQKHKEYWKKNKNTKQNRKKQQPKEKNLHHSLFRYRQDRPTDGQSCIKIIMYKVLVKTTYGKQLLSIYIPFGSLHRCFPILRVVYRPHHFPVCF